MNAYDSMPGIRRSDLWKINKTPYHFRYEVDHPAPKTPALLFGAAAHKYILEPKTFSDEYAVAPIVDRRTKEGKAVWADFTSNCEVKQLEAVTADDFEQIQNMCAAIDQHPVARKLLTGEHEKVFTWTDGPTGENCKVKVDCLTEFNGQKCIVDYKTTESCEDGAFERSCRRYGYKFQAGMYREGVFQNTFEEYGFAFVAQEKTEPYAVRVYFCSKEFIDEGYDQYRVLLGLYHICNVSNYWPGYSDADLLGEG